MTNEIALMIAVVAAGRGSAEPEGLPHPLDALQAAGSVGERAQEHALRPRHQDHLHLRHELRRIPARRADMPLAGEREKTDTDTVMTLTLYDLYVIRHLGIMHPHIEPMDTRHFQMQDQVWHLIRKGDHLYCFTACEIIPRAESTLMKLTQIRERS